MASTANNANLISSLTTNFNVTPYYDDFNSGEKDFYRILFKPGYAVQSRELTQIQSMVQSQIYRFGKHVFKEGDIVIPGAFTFKMNVGDTKGHNMSYIKINNTNGSGDTVNVQDFVGEVVTGSISGISAKIETVLDTDGTAANTKTLYTSTFLNASEADSSVRTFVDGETLTTANGLSAVAVSTAATGYSSWFSIDDGVVFAKDHFISFCEQQTILDRYNASPTCKVGFYITEDIINASQDTSLLDPALESSNYSAPGADRLKLTASLSVRAIDDPIAAPNFVTLFTVKDGVIDISNEKTQYNILGDSMARRTYEESGDYLIRGYNVTIQEHDKITGSVPNYGRFTDGDNTKLVVGIDSGHGYVKGYPVTNGDKFEVVIDKPRDFRNVSSQIASTTQGQYLLVNEMVGTWELDKGNRINLYDTVQRRVTNSGVVTGGKWSTGAQTGNNIGNAIVNEVQYVSGTPGYDAIYGVFLSDIKMTGSNTFSNVRSVYYDVASVSDPGGDIVGANNTTSNTSLQAVGLSTLLYYTGANYVKSTKDVNGQGATTYYFNQTQGVSSTLNFGTGGTITVTHSGSTNEIIPYTVSSVVGDTDVSQDFIVALNQTFNIGPLWSGATVSGSGSTITGVGTYFNYLNVGDKVEFAGQSGTWYVTAIASNTSMTVSNTVSGLSGAAIFKAYKNGDIINLTGKGVNAGGKRTITATSNTQFTIDLKESFPSTIGTTVTYKVAKTNCVQAAKTLTAGVYVKISCATAGTTGPFCLGFSDVYRVSKVIKKTGSAPTTTSDGTDVTQYFILNNGQTDTNYDLATISRNGISLGGTDYLLVELDYFVPNYSGSGAYFSIDSYPIQDDDALATSTTIRTENVPIFTSPTTQYQYDLRNHLDFRPVKTVTASPVTTTIASAPTNPSNNSTTYVYTGAGMKFPVPFEPLTFDYSYYIGRKDIVTINKDGVISVTPGIPSSSPVMPDCLDTQMMVAVLDIAPYPSISPAYGNVLNRRDLACGQKKVSIRGYTMRDIGLLEKRIQNLEYYTALTLLEKDALSFKILDANGNDRFKNGYFIDTFKDGSLSAKGIDPDFRIVFDPTELAIRPMFSTDSFGYEYVSGNGIAVNAGKVTFDYTQEMFFQQPRVTNTRNLERGTYYFQGQMTLFPNQDVWVDTSFADDETVTIKTDNSLISITTSSEADVAAQVKKSFLNTTWEPWKANIIGYNLYRGEGTSKAFVGRFDSEAQARAVAATWTTQPKYVTEGFHKFGSDAAYNDWVARYTARGTTATLETIYNNTRLGTNWFANESVDTAAGGNKLISSDKIPYIRPQEIVVQIQGLKPFSKMHAFFDGVNVSEYCTPLTASQFPLALARSPLPLGQVAAEGADLIVDTNGNLYFILKIAKDGPKFKTGDRKLIVLDSEQLNPETLDASLDASTIASGYFFADGTKQTLQRTVYSTSGYKKTGEGTSESYQSEAQLVLPNTWSPDVPPKGHCCFSPNARVLMADFTWKAIKDVVPGDKVIGDNGAINTVEKNKSIATGGRKMVNFNGGDWYSTNDHLFLTKNGWKTWDPQHVINDKNTKNDIFLVGENKEKSIDLSDELKIVSIVEGKVVESFVPYSGLSAEVHDFDPSYVVHDLTLDGNMTYIVEGYVVHNCCVAYTVLVQVPADEEGIFVTSFDVFVQRKSQTRPLWFEIREMDSAGNVTDVQMPGSVVRIENEDILESTNGIDNPLNIKFNAPLFLFNNKPYAFVVHSYAPGGMTIDPDTSLWISRLGETDINTGEVVNQRQRMGKFFQTTNNKQWYEVADVDLAINVYRANFQTGTATLIIGQQPVEKFFLSNVSSSLTGRIGDHFVTGDTLTITGANTSGGNVIAIGDRVIGNTSGGAASGNVVSLVGGNDYAVSNTRYVIGEKVNIFNTSGGYKGITGIVTAVANSHAQLSYYDESSANIYAEFTTSTGGFVQNTVIQSVRDAGYNYRAEIKSINDYKYSAISFEPNVLDFVKTAFRYDMQTYANGSTTVSGYETVIPSETHYFPEEKVIYSKTNEIKSLNSDHSNKIRVTLESTSSYVSPLFDINSSHSIFVNNLISSNSYMEGVDANSSNVTITSAPSGGYAINKYISQAVALADGQDAEDIQIFVSAYRPPNTDVKVFVKILNPNDGQALAQKNWIELVKQSDGDLNYSSLGNRYDFKEYSYGFHPTRMTGPNGEVQYTANGTTFTGYKYYAIKIVLTADNSAVVPRVADLRAIALQI